MKKKNDDAKKRSAPKSGNKRRQTRHSKQDNKVVASAKEKLQQLIPSSKMRGSQKRNIQLDKAAVEEVTNALSNDMSITCDSGETYRLTPKGVLLAVLDHYYKAGNDLQKFDACMKELCQHLSMLATNDTQADMFGDDFNSLFDILVSSMNLSGRMKEVLDENGIEFNVTEFLQSINSECTEKQDDEDSDEDDFKPKRKK